MSIKHSDHFIDDDDDDDDDDDQGSRLSSFPALQEAAVREPALRNSCVGVSAELEALIGAGTDALQLLSCTIYTQDRRAHGGCSERTALEEF